MSDEYEVFERDIAIVGMAARLPGAQNVHEYWRNLVGGVESIRDLTEDELRAAGESAARLRDPQYVKRAAPIEGMSDFDGEFFGFSPKESAIMDPQHRHFLECCWEALESSAHPPEKFDGPIGVFAGCGMGSYLYFNLCSHPELVRDVGMFLLRHTGNDKDFLATRASYLLNLTGPAVNVQTACSTSLVATHMAMQSLLSGECDMALAGGVTIELPHGRGYRYEEGEILSPDGRCRAFDHRSQGTVFGSGAGVVVLRRMDDALDDGDVIHGVIRGSAVNNDGSSKVNYLAPSVDGQAACLVEALGVSDVDARSIEYIECHGTGTVLGDPIEVEALTAGYRTQTEDRGFCRIGSVKSNIGHLDTAAGVAGLIKATLALKHAQIPPTLGFEKPNPRIDFESSPFRVASELTEWPAPSGHPRRAAVNSLGVGGTNAHIILQEPPGAFESDPPTREVQLLTLSARTKRSLDAQCERLAEYLSTRPDASLADVAFTLRHGRREFGQRRVLAATDVADAVAQLGDRGAPRVYTHGVTDDAQVAFLLPGGGAQYPRMAADLYDAEDVFREQLDAGLALLQSKHGIDLRPLLYPAAGEEAAAEDALSRMDRQLPATFITSVAIARLFESWGVKPAALLGHSMGENTAAHLAGVMSFEDALGLVVLRGQLFEETDEGAMLSVSLTATELEEMLPSMLDLATINGPESCVVSGRPADVDAFEAKLRELSASREQAGEDALDVRRIAIPAAAHSRLLDPILERFEAYLRSITLNAPTLPFLSNTSGEFIRAEEATDPMYWVRHLRSTVRFADNVDRLLSSGASVLVETGPGRTLSSLARQSASFDAGAHHAFPSVRHHKEDCSDEVFFAACLGRVWASGGAVDIDRWWEGETRNRVELPTYAWDHKSYFIEPAEHQAAVETVQLQKREDVAEWGYVHRFRPSVVDAVDLDPALVGEAGVRKRRFVLFMDNAGVGERLREALLEKGHEVIAVFEGDAFRPHPDDPDAYLLSPERGLEGYTSLVTALVERGHTPERVVHLSLVESEARFRPGSSLFHHHLERGFYSLFFLGKALAEASLTTSVHLTVVGNGLLRVDTEALPFPQKACVLGPATVLPRELEGATVRVVDVQVPEQGKRADALRAALRDPLSVARPNRATATTDAFDTLAEQLLGELHAAAESEVIALREEGRFTRVLTPFSLTEGADSGAAYRDRGVYLITGGLGGLGLTFARHLAETKRARLVLVGRSALPPRAQWSAWIEQHGHRDVMSRKLQQLLDVEDAGGEVLALAADITNLADMRRVREEAEARFGAVHGILHAAGVVDDDLIAMKTLDSVQAVFAPKVQGTRILEEVFDVGALELMVLFSSTSTATAPAGQVDYVAANAYLDAYAEQKHGEGHTHVKSVHWGIWNEVGMVATAFGAHRAAGERVGQQPEHVWLRERVSDGHGGSVLRARFDAKTHWVLDGHRTKDGQALLPGTGYVELIRAALRANGEQGPFEIEDLFFLRPFDVGEDVGARAGRDLTVRLRPTSRGYAVELRGAVSRDGQSGTVLCAEAQVVVRNVGGTNTLTTIDATAIRTRCTARILPPAKDAFPTAQEAHLRFGPRWRSFREACWGEGEALARVALDAGFAAETNALGLHPALLDIATGWAMELIDGYDAQHLWVPVSYEHIAVHGDLPSEVLSWVRTRGTASTERDFVYFDVVLADTSGNVLVEVSRLGLRKLESAPRFGAVAASEIDFDDSSESRRSAAEDKLAEAMAQGILPAEGTEALSRAITAHGGAQLFISSMDLPALVEAAGAQEEAARGSSISLERPELESEFVAPRNAVEETLVGFWQELLGVDRVGVEDSFFDLGGHSLIAVRLFARIKRTYRVDFPISVLFEAPTIAQCAALVREAMPQSSTGAQSAAGDANAPAASPSRSTRRYTHLVRMHTGDGGPKTPFFLVAGMFGNVLNLRHLAQLIGTDRRFYGLQARGLYGDEAPHETFEEMASAYIEEVRTVQPDGPYFLGGFSGGGITAYEIARQLEAAGEEVALLVMLDTPVPQPVPKLSLRDRATIQRQQLADKGTDYLVEWAQNRWAWEAKRLRRRFEDTDESSQAQHGRFHDEAIEAAFRRALGRYEVPKRPEARVELFRPKLPVAFHLHGGRKLSHERSYVFEDNGWTPFVKDVRITEVPGDHDSMVLEPNVRVLAQEIRSAIRDAEATLRVGSMVQKDAS